MKKLVVICSIMAVVSSLSATPVADNLGNVPQGKPVTAGTNCALLNTDALLFNDFQSAGDELSVQQQPATGSFSHFSVFTKNLSTDELVLIYGKSIAEPYVYIDSENILLTQHTPESPIIAQGF